MTKRSDGDGSWVRRGPKSWELRFQITGADGTRKRYSTYGPTKQVAREKAAKVRERIAREQPARDSRDSLDAWFRTWRGKHLGASTLRQSTRDQYAGLIASHVIPRYGHRPLRSLVPSDFDALFAEVQLGASSKRSLYAALVAMFRAAVRDKLLADSPMAGVPRPKQPAYQSRALTGEEVRAVVAAGEGHDWHLALVTLAVTGLRRSELLGLDVDCLDTSRGVLHIRQALTRTSAGLTLGPPKSAAGIREVPLPGPLADLLRAHRVRQRRLALEYGDLWKSPALFSGPLGEWIEPRSWSRFYTSCARKAGVSDEGGHAMRHAAATRLVSTIGNGASLADVQRLLGHSKPDMTLGLYAAAQEAGKRSAVEQASEGLL
jgi:integrase